MKDKELEFTDGKNRSSESKASKSIYDSKDLESLLDMGKMNPYGTIDKETFAEKVEKMGIEQMRNLAIRVGVTPTNRQNQMRKRLLDNFDSYVSRHRAVKSAPKPSVDPSSEEYKNIEHLLKFD